VKKIAQFIKKWPKQSPIQKDENIYIKAHFESPNHVHQTTFETLK
jgi:hypothetical protein